MEVSLNVVIGESRNINSFRGGGSFNVFTKVEFQAEILGESSRHELSEGISHVNMDLSVSRVCRIDTNAAVENIMRNPLIVSVFEVLPKDKKAKEEKTQLLGVGSLDLLPFFKGEQVIEDCLVLYPLNYQPNETDPPSLIELDISVSTNKLILSEQEKEHGNILFLRVKGLYSLPDPLAAGGAHTYTVATPSPSHLINPIDVLAAQGGEVRNSGNADIALANKKWKWPSLNPSSVGMASLISDSTLLPNAVEDEKGHLKNPSDIEIRRLAECTKPSVSWNMELRVLLSSKTTSAFLSSLSLCSLWPVEIIRVLNIAGKGKLKDETTLSYNGVSYVDLSTLLYPGATKIFGAYRVGAVIESELGKKCTVTSKSVIDNIHKATATPVKSLAVGKRPGTSARQSVISLASQSSMTGLDDNGEGQVYSESQSYLLLEFELAKPLVPKRTAVTIADRIMEYIPPRPALPKRAGGVQKAINDYHTATVDVASLLLADYRSLYGDEIAEDVLENTMEANEERRKKLIYHLNKSGHYHAYKEHLKKSVLELVRQKFINEASTINEEELQAFLSKLYTYLIDEMHSGLGQTFSLEQSVPDPPNIVDCDMLRQYALESEQMLNMEMAEYYHKELLSREGHVSLHWYEYGVYHLLNSDYDKAEQCFKESIALDQKFVPALLLCGICCTVNEKHDMANEVLELATTIDDHNTFAWTIRGLCCELSYNGLIRDMCLEQAYRLTPGGKKKTYIMAAEKVGFKKSPEKHLGEIEESELQSQVMSDKTMPLTDQVISEQPEAETPELTKDATSTPIQDSLNNNSQQQELQIQPSSNNDHEPPRECTETLSNDSKDDYEFSPFIQTASYLLDVNVAKFAEMCLAHEYVFLSSKRTKSSNERGTNTTDNQTKIVIRTTDTLECTTDSEITTEFDNNSNTPTEFVSLQYDINMGRLLMLNGDYEGAQTYLKRAVEKDILNSNAMALLGNCLYLLGEFDLAKDYYQRVVEYVNPPAHINTILLRLADIFMRHQEYSPAKFTYLRACRNSPSSITWKGVGIACYMLEEYENSEDALSEANILNNLDPEIWAYLSLLCVKTDRPEEAIQAASFALKTGLTNTDLLEILPRRDP